MRRAIRREAVFGFITPFVTALPRADVAWRRDTFASSTFFLSHGRLDFLYEALEGTQRRTVTVVPLYQLGGLDESSICVQPA